MVRGSASRLAVLALTVGLAFWVTGASLDVFAGSHGVTRVALVPAWPRLVLLLGLAAGGIGAAVVLLRRFAPSLAAAEVLLPLGLAGLLVLPYLPWLADAMPIVRVLAGPARWLLWAVAAGQVVWAATIAWKRSSDRAPREDRPPWARLAPVLMFAASATVFGLVAWRLAGPPLFPGGDEPHYLILAQSIWRDHDLKIENNHQRGDYREYFDGDLKPHYLARGVDGQIYSVHPVGLPFLIAPIYALGGYRGVLVFQLLMAAAASAVGWRWMARLLGARAPATFAWAAVSLSAPFVFNSFTVYPEIPAALAVMIALALPVPGGRGWRWLACGVAIGSLPWLSTKYAPMAAVLAVISGWRLWRWTDLRAGARAALVANAAAVFVPFFVSLAGWFAFFYAIWGSPWPTAAYGTYNQTSLARALWGAPGLLLDQEHGILAFAPVLCCGFTGLAAMWTTRGEIRNLVVELVATLLALLVTVGAFWIWWGGDAMPARPVVSGLLLLGLPIAWQYARAERSPVGRAAQQLLLLVGLAIAVTLLVAERGMLLAQGRDGASEFLRWLSPDWHLWSLAPSFIVQQLPLASAVAGVWLAVAAAAAFVLARLKVTSAGRAALAASAALVGALGAVSVLVPLLFGNRLAPDVNLDARARIATLDRFDAGARPLAIIYDPWRPAPASRVLSLMVFRASPGLRQARQPLPVLLNMRLALPPGDYIVRVQPQDGTALEGSIGLQIGRVGPTFEHWSVSLPPDVPWLQPFSLHLAASFVGLRASPEFERHVASIEIRPIHVVDRSARPNRPEVIGAWRSPAGAFYFHDDGVYQEETGFWLRGTSEAEMSVAPATATPPVLMLRAGPIAERVQVASPAGVQRFNLQPGEEAKIVLDTAMPIFGLRFATSQSFAPATFDPSSRDQRQLCCWVEVAGKGAGGK